MRVRPSWLFLVLAAVGVAVCYLLAVVVLGIALTGFWSSFAAMVLVVLAFQVVRRPLRRLAEMLAHGQDAGPYKALTQLSERLSHSPATADLLPAIAAAAGEAISARRVTIDVRLRDGGRFEHAWPSDDPTPDPDGERVEMPVVDGGETLGCLRALLPAGRALRGSERDVLTQLAERLGPAVRNARLEAELHARVAELDEAAARLADSRRRIVEARDAERRGVEQAIATAVLAELVTLPEEVNRLRPTASAGRSLRDLDPLLARVTAAQGALRELTRGDFPTRLARAGLGPALRSLTVASLRSVALEVDRSLDRRRFAAAAEMAVYGCCSDLAHRGSGPLRLHLGLHADALVLDILDVDPDLDAPAVQTARDRVEALGGSLSSEGHRGAVRLRVPVRSLADPPS